MEARIATSTYCAAGSRTPRARSVRDAELKTRISHAHADNFGVCGVRKVWRQLHHEGMSVARCTVARLTRDLGLEGARLGKGIRATIRDDGHDRASDLFRRDFTASRPNERWVADFTYVAPWSGIGYVAFVVDVFSRAIVGWSAATSKRSKLVLDALDMALWRRDLAGASAGPGLVHHMEPPSNPERFNHRVQTVSPASANRPRPSTTLAAVGAVRPSGRPGGGTAAGGPGGVRNAIEASVSRSASCAPTKLHRRRRTADSLVLMVRSCTEDGTSTAGSTGAIRRG
ncbi:DDE-type integrase/transposase/recombinase [Streptomyces sp. NPDC126497]|uniref:DDE-type integrase/transposase/recombinase n=1 Tax=Streptomyces sp. NPDC126497 TaxID=3155313 RepID=UPI0033347097